jgi:hypothetical protein
MRVMSDDGSASGSVSQSIYNNRAMVGGGTTVENRHQFQVSAESGWPTNGFEITYNAQLDGAFSEPYLAIQFSSNVTVTDGQATAPTSNGTNQTLTCADTPKLALVMHSRQTTANTADQSSANAALWGFGVTDGDGNERWLGISEDDGADPTVCGTYMTDSKGMQFWLPSTNALDGEADIVVNGSDFQAQFADAPPSAFVYDWLTIGVLEATPTGIPDVVMAPPIPS